MNPIDSAVQVISESQTVQTFVSMIPYAFLVASIIAFVLWIYVSRSER